MSNSSTQSIPGMDAMNETLDFVKNLWGGMAMPGMKIPGMIVPTLSVEEINKQIADLKAVESWLTLNMNMLRSTIQALEVQSATISTLQAMGESLSAAVNPAPRAEPPAPAWAPEAKPEPAAAKEAPAEPSQAKPPAEPAAGAPLPNPAMWWNMLQDQFKQAVGSAMAAEPAAPAKPSKPAKPTGPVKSAKAKPQPAAPKPRKTVAKSAAKTAPKAAASKPRKAPASAKGSKAD